MKQPATTLQNLRGRERRLVLLDDLLDLLDITVSFLQLTDEQLTGKTTPQTADMEVFEEILAGRLGQLSTRNEEDVRGSEKCTGRRKGE